MGRKRRSARMQLKSFGIDLLALADEIGCDHVSVFVDTSGGKPFVSGFALRGDRRYASVDWFPEGIWGGEGE